MSIISAVFSQRFKTFFKKFRKFNSLRNIDRQMLDYINFRDGFFIECGANDGVDQSNTWYYEKYLNWKGVLIEPLSKQFKELKKNRNKKNLFINGALVGSDTINTVNIYDDNLQSKIIINNKEKSLFKKREANAFTLTKILENNNCPNFIDFFSLDVEGFEDEVLKGINFKKFNFNYFLIETKNDNVVKLLTKNNYKFIKNLTEHDLLFQFQK